MKESITVSFNTHFLKNSAINLAKTHQKAGGKVVLRPIKPILEASKITLTETYRALSKIVKSDKELTPASEWLMDNFYIIQEQMVQVAIDFPKAYQKNIPTTTKGEFKGLPRVYEIVLNMLTHTDNILDFDVLTEYVNSYQEEETLQLGELWAIPIMARLFLIEILAKKANRILEIKNIKIEVENFVLSMEGKDLREPGFFSHAISNWVKRHEGNSGLMYLLELYNQLQTAGLLHEEQNRWFHYYIRQYEVVLEDALHQEAQKQSRLQVNIQNAIFSLRQIAETEWSDFVEDCSVINHIFKNDPSCHYSKMDFNTRDRYYKVVEKMSRHSTFSEEEVAGMVLQLAKKQDAHLLEEEKDQLLNQNHVKRHIGYYLIGNGYGDLIRETGYHMPIKERLHRAFERHFSLYLTTVFLLTLFFISTLYLATGVHGYAPMFMIAIILISVFPALDLSISIIHRFFAFFLPPRVLPKMDYKEGIPSHSRTLVVMPTLISSEEDVLRQIENLEVQFLANPDPGLQFAILSDFKDAKTKYLDSDDATLKTATAAIIELNQKYTSKYGDKFFLLHRERLWNESENAWMGWERKRGKLEELNHLICDPTYESSYCIIAGDFFTSIISPPVQYIITLDADTKLPPGSAKKLISAISHPLNRAVYDVSKGRVTQGYSIIQPRISFSPESAQKTWFSKIFSGKVGVDPYSAAVSDIYQDLTGEAIFTGKGIYDVRAFRSLLQHQLPENRILSHDLIESTYLRAGLATDIELYDDYPGTYASYSKRVHRWTRGDWQIASWIFPFVPGKNGRMPNPINLQSKWKILDNLRRSLNYFTFTLFFIAGLFWLPGSAWIWILAAFGILAFPTYVSLYSDLLNRQAKVRWKLHMAKVRENLKINTIQSLSVLIILPHQALIQIDAILRTLYRLFISKKWLLEWTTSSQQENSESTSLWGYCKVMSPSVILGIGIMIMAYLNFPHYLWIVTPFFMFWAGAPVYVWLISKPIITRLEFVSELEKRRLRMYARRTWLYFERFVNEDHCWLPPDNYQEDPPLLIAHRTSPTNIGMAIVSNQTAYNMGFITLGMLLERQQKSLHAILKLKKYNGHLFNWYETQNGEVLSPHYISTVDSGNLAASIIVAKEAIKEVMKTKDINKHFILGLRDTLFNIKDMADLMIKKEESSELYFIEIIRICDAMIGKLYDENKQLRPVDTSVLQSLWNDASLLRDSGHLPPGIKSDDPTLETLLFCIKGPFMSISSALNECSGLSLPQSQDFKDYTPEELIHLCRHQQGERFDNQMYTQWESQASDIISVAEKLVREMDFSFLYLKERGLFHIGYNMDNAQFDKSTYDLLASEARIASYIAIAKGDISVEHWFKLSRRLTSINREEILLSWGGTMFEYLMPLLFLKSYPDTLMSHTYRNVVDWQIAYGNNRGLPWGHSESAYYFLNIDLHYQYRTFGVPGLGLKRGLADEYVVAPYASMLSLMIATHKSIRNLMRIQHAGGLGIFGFYDAIDYTPSHLHKGELFQVVKTYMVHHQGMSLIALDNVLNDRNICHHFHSDSRIKSCELLLQERIPRGAPIKEPHPIDAELEPRTSTSSQHVAEYAGIDELDAHPPRLHTLSNGTFSTMITHAGSGYSKTEGVMLNVWKPDPVLDPLGLFIYIKDTESGHFWSGMHLPVKSKPDRYDTWFHNGKVVCSRVDHWIETTTEICVSTEYNIELRKITFTNYAKNTRTLEITSYAEIMLNRMIDHNAHPAFSKLFIETEFLEAQHAIIAKRRPRSKEESPLYIVHTFACNNQNMDSAPLTFETERSHFIGRGRSLSHPLAMTKDGALGEIQGNVSDPIVSFRKKIHIEAGQKVTLTFGLGFAKTREEAIEIANQYNNQLDVNRAFDLASIYGYVELIHHGIKTNQAHQYQKLSSFILYADAAFRPSKNPLNINLKKQKDLWAYGISGDFPLVIFHINHTNQVKQVQQLLKAHSFWRIRGIECELLIINDHPPGYIDEIQESIQSIIESSLEREVFQKKGGIFVLRSDKIQHDDHLLFSTVAHAIFYKQLPLFSMANRIKSETNWNNGGKQTTFTQLKEYHVDGENMYQTQKQQLQFFNGFGGFFLPKNEYHILIKSNIDTGLVVLPPAPWINVIANENFGFTISERGAGYTWSENSRENKLTSWSNDPVTDSHSEAFYIRDEINMKYWSPCPGPSPNPGFYLVRHGFGYTCFEHHTPQIEQILTQFVPEKDAIKISKLTLKNNSHAIQKISVLRYLDRVLGVERNTASRFVTQKASADGKTIYATNSYNNEFANKTVFLSVVNPVKNASYSFTTDRKYFIGRNQTLSKPYAVTHEKQLNNHITDGEDPCAALQTIFDLESGKSITLFFLEGESHSHVEADRMIEFYNDPLQVDAALSHIQNFWKRKLSKMKISTPDPSFDLMMNGWLMYQNISSRMWARTGFYQSGGAYGFRDQLQDATAALYFDPEICRNQIIRHASQQFIEGDVLHWWHPPTGRGIRSTITDDRLWLPYTLEFYLNTTGDHSILHEKTHYISARTLEPFEKEAYLQPSVIAEKGSIYEHCCKAIDLSLKFGTHGFPLIGGGDWNDGMNRVGEGGKGESVWLGFFIYSLLVSFEKICLQMNDEPRAKHYLSVAKSLKNKLNNVGWDGEWYLRAFYDDGTPIGSASNLECKIDAISQAWSIISNVATPSKGQQALKAVEQHLVSTKDMFIRLLTPPFDKTDKDPGYIKGYIPGVRENGGQYTHAALWVVKAFATLGMGNKAYQYMHMINPINHSHDMESTNKYKVEPYVIAADVYGEDLLSGQGGWTWYTGSAGWMYRIGLESILGLQLKGHTLTLNPSISDKWNEYRIELLLDDNQTRYFIHISNPHHIQCGRLEGKIDDIHVSFNESPAVIPLAMDKQIHHVKLNIIPMSTFTTIIPVSK